jgi:DNA-binding transcriptional ArsR family regulator
VRIPAEAYSANLTDYQFRLLATICHLQGSGGRFKTSVAELGRQTGKTSDRTVRTALKALEEAGFLTRSQSRRANGFKGMDWYEVVENYRTGAENYRAENYRTSHGYKSRSQIVDKPLVPNSQDSYKLKDIEEKDFLKEIKVPMRKWEDDGEDLAGFGLVEPKEAAQPRIRKSDPKTRGKRPEHEWTPMDVAAEFSYQVGRLYPLLPGTVNVKSLSGALAKFRGQYNTTALIELELLRLFIADERNFEQIGDEAPFLYKKYLASFGKKMNQARENLGLTKVNAPVQTSVKIGTLTASDGRVFQNSLSGRAQLERYEKRLGANK